MSRLLILLLSLCCVSGSALAQGKSGSHGGGPPSSVPAGGSAPASPPSGGSGGSASPSLGSSSSAVPVSVPTSTTAAVGGTPTATTLPALPALPSGSGLPATPSLVPPSPGSAADCVRDGRCTAKPGEAGKCQ